MSRGHSQHWREILHATTGKDHISVNPIKRYYRPLYKFLSKLVQKNRIPIGWWLLLANEWTNQRFVFELRTYLSFLEIEIVSYSNYK